jgi:hypothetical protein
VKPVCELLVDDGFAGFEMRQTLEGCGLQRGEEIPAGDGSRARQVLQFGRVGGQVVQLGPGERLPRPDRDTAPAWRSRA